MGNRAHVIFTGNDNDISPAVYLHWNGGPESIYAFLDELERRNCSLRDPSYACARFCHVVGDFFDQNEAGSSSLGITNGPATITPEALEPFNHGDNGVYVVTHKDGKRVVRRFVGYDKLVELSLSKVEAERKIAYKSKYHINKENPNNTIAATFLNLPTKGQPIWLTTGPLTGSFRLRPIIGLSYVNEPDLR